MTVRAAELLEQATEHLAEIGARLPCECKTPEEAGTRSGYTCAGHREVQMLADCFSSLAARLRDALTVIEAAREYADERCFKRKLRVALSVFDAGPAATEKPQEPEWPDKGTGAEPGTPGSSRSEGYRPVATPRSTNQEGET